ncbi:MAG: 4-oxalocrotonate tautomerase [Candidatus Methanomethylicota archaeon]|uniref:4-oxalocrotonate tautomerase n=1 Tax=Thermoproteota archaeon TaxID=2056631 RepID=A0A497EUA8_9CREN|nr:MAG: 4-oxalocrotonate tautomerase [Candidatus Verstraetearchaeota archaeon]
MPIIVFEGPKLTKEQKEELVKLFTDAAQKVTGIRREAFIVLIKENEPDNVGVCGELLSNIISKES